MNDKNNPYSPPKADVKDTSQPVPRPILGVVVGTVVDIGGTIVAGILVGIVFVMVLSAQGAPSDEVESSIAAASSGSLVLIIGMGVGSLFSILGGYLCARISKTNLYRQGAVLSCVVIALAILMRGPLDFGGMDVFAILVTVAAIFFGVWVYARKNKHSGSW